MALALEQPQGYTGASLGFALEEGTSSRLLGFPSKRLLAPSPTDFAGKPIIREKQRGGWKTQGRGKHTIKPLPQNGFGYPHL